MTQTKTRVTGGLSRLTSVSAMYSYIYCLMASQALIAMPLLGGALYMCGQVGTVFFTGYAGVRRKALPRVDRRLHTVILCLLMAISLAMAVLYPRRVQNEDLWMLFALVAAMLLRDGLGAVLVHADENRPFRRGWLIADMVAIHLLPALAILWIFLTQLQREDAWYLVAGYMLCDLLSAYAQVKAILDARRDPVERAIPQEKVQSLHELLEHANAFRVYETLSTLVVAAVELTMVLLYTWVATTPEEVLIHTAVAVGVAFASREGVEWWLRRRQTRRGQHSDPSNIMLIGLFLWLFGLNTFRRAIGGHSEIMTLYICLALSSAGSTLCVTVLGWLEQAMAEVAEFTAGEDLTGYRTLRQSSLRMASLIGQMAALVTLAVVCFIADDRVPWVPAASSYAFRPVLVLPALLTVFAAVVFTFRFPLSALTLDKLSRFLHMQEENPCLKAQLEHKVVEEHRQPFVTRGAKAIVRTLWKHQLLHTENIRPDDSNPLVFLCNHGDLYGPMISVSYIPVHVRPWSISSVMSTEEEVFAYIYKYSFENNPHVPRFLRRRLALITSRLSIWCMRQLECIPVYREKPTLLMKTFRASVEALQTGDNLLIFPENPNAGGQDHGYETSGLGELFTGFTMLAPIYYNRTGKACRFLPMYANKQTRKIAFGTEIVYDPASDPHSETGRIVRLVREEMQALMEETSVK